MAHYVTSMERLGFHQGMSMLEVLASTRFIQGFDLLGTSAEAEVSDFIASHTDGHDLDYLRLDIEGLLGFETERDMRHYLHLMGASYWPLNESIRDVFARALRQIDERQAELSSPSSS